MIQQSITVIGNTCIFNSTKQIQQYIILSLIIPFNQLTQQYIIVISYTLNKQIQKYITLIIVIQCTYQLVALTVYYCHQLYLSISRSSSCEGVQKDLNVVRNVFTNLGSAYIWYVSRSISFSSVPPLISGISVGEVPVSSITMLSGLSFFANLKKQNNFITQLISYILY